MKKKEVIECFQMGLAMLIVALGFWMTMTYLFGGTSPIFYRQLQIFGILISALLGSLYAGSRLKK